MSKSSGSQLYIKIISILNIIGGALFLLIGILAIFGKNVVGDSALIEQAGNAEAPAAVTAFIIALILSGVFSLIKLVPPALMLWCAHNVKNQTNL